MSITEEKHQGYDNLPVLSWSLDRNYNFVRGNSAFHFTFKKYLGLSFEAGDYFFENLPREKAHDFKTWIDRAFQGESLNRKVESPWNGFNFLIEYHLFYLPASGGAPECVQIVADNISGLKKHEINVDFLLNITIELMSCSTLEELYNYAADKIYSLFDKNVLIYISDFDRKSNQWQGVCSRGLSPFLSRITSIINMAPEDLRFNVPAETYKKMSPISLTRLDDSLFHMSGGKISQKMERLVRKILPIKGLYAISFRRIHEVYGSISILPLADNVVIERELIEAFVAQTSHVIEKLTMENEMRRREDFFHSFFLKSPLPYQILDAQGQILYVNPPWSKLTGVTAEEAVGFNFQQFMAEGDVNFISLASAVREPGEAVEQELLLKNSSGDPLTVRIIINSDFSPEDKNYRYNCILQDVTRLKEALRLLDTQKKQTAALGDFIPICSWCNKIRTSDWGEEEWMSPSDYISRKLPEIRFSHSICPDCIDSLYPDMKVRGLRGGTSDD